MTSLRLPIATRIVNATATGGLRRTHPLPQARLAAVTWLAVSLATFLVTACVDVPGHSENETSDAALIAQGKQIFRFETFGDESQWTDILRLHEVIRASVDPITALSVGLKVDAEALPAAVVKGIQDRSINM